MPAMKDEELAVVPTPDTTSASTFRQLLVNTLVSGVTNSFLWFALVFWVYLETSAATTPGGSSDAAVLGIVGMIGTTVPAMARAWSRAPLVVEVEAISMQYRNGFRPGQWAKPDVHSRRIARPNTSRARSVPSAGRGGARR